MNEENQDLPLIDVRKVFHDKNPKMARWIPGFLFRFFEKLIRQEDLNRMLTKAKGLKGVDFARSCFEDIGVTIISKNTHYVPSTGRLILAANHPLGGLDGMKFIRSDLTLNS